MRILLRLIVVLALMLPGAARADEAAVRDVIAQQIDAFQRDDFDTAFEHASPMIQNMFGTADGFGAMIREGYPMVWRPASIRFSLLRQEGERFFQQVVLGGDTHSYVAEYEVMQVDGIWRINGVQLLPESGTGA